MSLIYTQTDNASICTFQGWGRQAIEGATPGTGSVTESFGGNTSRTVGFEIIPGADVDWNTGTLTTRLLVSDGHVNITLDSISILRVNASCGVQETLGTLNVGVSLANGVFTHNVTISAVANPAVDDKLLVQYLFSRGSGGGTRNITVTFSENIDTPFTGPEPPTQGMGSVSSKGQIIGLAPEPPTQGMGSVLSKGQLVGLGKKISSGIVLISDKGSLSGLGQTPLILPEIAIKSNEFGKVVLEFIAFEPGAASHDIYRSISTMAGDPEANGIRIGEDVDPLLDFEDTTVDPATEYFWAPLSRMLLPVQEFIMLVNTQNTGSSNTDQFQFTGALGNYDVEVWNSAGDSLLETITGLVDQATITIAQGPGIYELRVIPAEVDGFHRIRFNSTGDRRKLIEVRDLGDVAWSTMNSAFRGCLNLTTFVSPTIPNFSNVQDMGEMFQNCLGLTSLDVSNFNTSIVQDMSWMFSDCSGLTSLDLSNFNTVSVLDMGNMFWNCSGLTSLDVSSFNTSSVTNMASMFSDCSSLTSLNISNFNTSNVQNMSWMFQNCLGLTSLDVSNFNTSIVQDMSWMFSDCSGLTSLDLSNFNTSSVTDMGGMFNNFKMTSLDVSSFNTSNVTNMSSMFNSCSELTSLDVSNWDTSSVDRMSWMFRNCSSLTDIIGIENFVITSVTTFVNFLMSVTLPTTRYSNLLINYEAQIPNTGLSFHGGFSQYNIAGQTARDSLTTTYSWTITDGGLEVQEFIMLVNTQNTGDSNTDQFQFTGALGNYDVEVWNSTGDALLETITGLVDAATITIAQGPGIYELRVIPAEVDGFHRIQFNFAGDRQKLIEVRNLGTVGWSTMDSAFRGCSNMTSFVSPTTPDFSNVQDMSYMFSNCTGLTSLDVSNFNTSSVLSMSSMFSDCSGLTSLDVSNFNTASVLSMSSMFSNCSGLTSLDLSNFDTSSVQNMSWMFYGCSGLTSLAVSNFNTASVGNTGGMFWNCTGLTSLDVSNFNTASVQDMGYMFTGCSNLTSLDLSNFDTSSVGNTGGMFSDCSGLTSLDLSNFNTVSVLDMGNMFWNCSGLTSLDVSSFNTSSVTNMASMFSDCSGLTDIIGIENFVITSVTTFSNFLNGVTLPTTRYSNLLINYEAQSPNTGLGFHGGFSKYNTAGQTARDSLTTTYSWTITDGGLEQ